MELEVFDDEIRTKNHKTRLAKVELYLEVPTQDGETVLGEDGTLGLIEKALEKEGITFTSFGDINLSPVFDDNLNNHEKPVGYLAPDGKFYVIESDEDGLAHLGLAPLVANVYDVHQKYSSLGIDHELELQGFIKVHEHAIRYFSGVPYNPYAENVIESPDPTEEQKKSLVEYIKKFKYDMSEFNDNDFVTVNDHYYSAKELIKILKEGDELSVRKVFEI